MKPLLLTGQVSSGADKSVDTITASAKKIAQTLGAERPRILSCYASQN